MRAIVAQRMTQEEYRSRLAAKKKRVVPLERYAGSKIKIAHRCEVCGHEWEVSPALLLKGRGCPVCAEERKWK